MRTLLLLLLLAAPVLGGCSGPAPPGPRIVAIESAEYDRAFRVTRDQLRRMGFVLDRVDGREGVITTRPKESQGIATPWMRDESIARHEFENYLQRQRRRVEVSFTPPGGQGDLRDALDAGEPVEMRVRVVVERVYRFGVQADAQSIRSTSVWRDPELEELGAQPSFAAYYEDDDWLAARIAARVGRRFGDTP